METIIAEVLVNYGAPGVVILSLGWFIIFQTKRLDKIQGKTEDRYEKLLEQSNNREVVQNQRFDEQQKELSKLSALLEMLTQDLRDIRRKVGIKKEEK